MGSYSQRKSNLYSPGVDIPFRISRSAISLFLECPRCFYLDKKIGLGRPSMPGFSLNMAVDQLLKNEFDILRKNGESHTLMQKYDIDAVPFNHPDFPAWRDDIYQRVGAYFIHKKTNFKICGIIDDIWINPKKELLIVDYKATSTSKEISLEDEYKKGYKIQMEVYQWIFRKMGFQVNKTGYFVFANAGKNRPKFDGRLEFALSILPYQGNDDWVEPIIFKIKECLESNQIPKISESCAYCGYIHAINKKIEELIEK